MLSSSEKKYAGGASVFRIYFRQVRKYPVLLVLIFLGATGIQAATLAAPLYLREFFNTLASSNPGPAIAAQLLGVVGILTLIYLTEWVVRRLQDVAMMHFESRVMSDLFSNSFRYLLGHSYNFFISHFAGSLTHRVSKFARAFEIMFDAIALQFFPTLLFVTGAVVVLFIQNRVLGTALGIWAILFIVFQLYVAKLRQPVRAERSDADTKITASIADSISNHSTIVLFAGEEHEIGLFKRVVAVWQKVTLKSWLADNMIWSGIGLFMIVIEIGLLYGATVFWGKGLLTVGDFVLIQAYLLTTFDRLISINRDLRRFFDAFADSSEMAYVLELPHGVPDVAGAQPLQVSDGLIEFRDVDFAFTPGKPVLADFNLTIAGGERVALVGPSGAGKSTVTKLLLRFFDITSGTIEIDGQDISRVTQDSLRERVSYVPQEPILFHRSLMENIRYGKRTATDAEVRHAAKLAHCHEFISTLPHGYDTYVGERGVKLSGGERQRVAIARAILKDSPILVLDEATSSLDSESESLIQKALDVLMQGKTVIVIAHRLSTIMKMDRILVIQQGKIASEGTHAQLLHSGGLYQKLWDIQAGGFIGGEEDEEVDVEEDEGTEEKGPKPHLPIK